MEPVPSRSSQDFSRSGHCNLLQPNNQRLLCALLRKVTEKRGTQVLLTIHSRHVVDALSSSSGFLWVRNGTVERAGTYDEIGVLLDIGALDIQERATQAGTTVVILTEDEITKGLEVLLEASGFDMKKTAVLPYYGITSTKNLRPLVKVIGAGNPKAKIVVHRDRDFLGDEDVARWERDVRALKAEPFVTSGMDVESYFLNPVHLALINEHADEDESKQLIVEAVDLLALTRRVGAFHYDPSLMQVYYATLSGLTGNRTLRTSEWTFLQRAVLAVEAEEPSLWAFLQRTVIDGRTRLTVRQWLDQGRPPRPVDLSGVRRLIFAASPLSRVMPRHTRPLLELYRQHGQLQDNLARRHIQPIPRIVFTEQERQAYEQLETYCRGLAAQMARPSSPQSHSAMGFLLSFLRLRIASSLFAIRETLRRRLERVEAALSDMELADTAEPDEEGFDTTLDDGEDDRNAAVAHLRNRTAEELQRECLQLRGMLRTVDDLSGPSSKMNELLRTLNQRRIRDTGRFRQTVIFTRFYDTLSDLVSRLRRVAPGAFIGTYSGRGGQYWDPATSRMVGVERDEIKHRFMRGEIDILVCTDATAEGLNLQSADLLVNFDLPWNPMKVEQRIGRIDCIGRQHRDIYVLNLCYADSAEDIVYGRLLTRLAQVIKIVGTQQMSLLPVMPEEFLELANATLSAETPERRALERVRSAEQRSASMEIAPQELYQIYARLTAQAQQTRAPVDLAAIWQTLCESRYLREIGCRHHEDGNEPFMIVSNIPGVAPGRRSTLASQRSKAACTSLPTAIPSSRPSCNRSRRFHSPIASVDWKSRCPTCQRRSWDMPWPSETLKASRAAAW